MDEAKRIYVLDTSVLLQDPSSIYQFQPHEVVIPAIVLEEVDAKKRQMDEVGHNARRIARMIDQLREGGKLHQGVLLDRGGFIRIELNHRSFHHLKHAFADRTNDNRIIAVALNLQLEENEKAAGRKVILVSKDAIVRVKADAFDLQSEDFLNERIVEKDEGYMGYVHVESDPEMLTQLFQTRTLQTRDVVSSCYPHQFLLLQDPLKRSSSALAKVDALGQTLSPVTGRDEAIWGIQARNVQQKMVLELLLNKDIPLVTLVGKAGTGKTLLSLAAGLFQTEDMHAYRKMVVTRPLVPLGKDIGYLPGEKEEKLRPWMQPIYDNLDFLFGTKKQVELDRILSGMGAIQIEALTYIRGRSMPDQYMIIDEAQNLTKHEVKTILTRVGERSKVVLMGDPEQIDHPYLDEYTNGLTYAVETFKEEALSGHVKLVKGERSTLAQLAADLL
ncbi:PhoH family protein [Shouchella lonarensis]|uniref:PhoH-like ATPase n=1 Tax=Shouchella lonarensis TaxID=1464122 RepID=A0A1G6KS20_9BACI|nr:PhoH family protein [Shouchella lonarensis]SDC33754.1 PhoH-like ATPase [Shouchella lonarensis]